MLMKDAAVFIKLNYQSSAKTRDQELASVFWSVQLYSQLLGKKSHLYSSLFPRSIAVGVSSLSQTQTSRLRFLLFFFTKWWFSLEELPPVGLIDFFFFVSWPWHEATNWFPPSDKSQLICTVPLELQWAKKTTADVTWTAAVGFLL